MLSSGLPRLCPFLPEALGPRGGDTWSYEVARMCPAGAGAAGRGLDFRNVDGTQVKVWAGGWPRGRSGGTLLVGWGHFLLAGLRPHGISLW